MNIIIIYAFIKQINNIINVQLITDINNELLLSQFIHHLVYSFI